ncbi:hypothetical protein HanPSC8_Chr03g0107291 [Helianthus annuus]|nr:hypothetical protein HanHA89_Chr03g0104271 [Helianthus annuus]KAJ0943658.1 hypothetical protein HanPSC8_Chr03g0107291 [Helianthus annuus]
MSMLAAMTMTHIYLMNQILYHRQHCKRHVLPVYTDEVTAFKDKILYKD